MLVLPHLAKYATRKTAAQDTTPPRASDFPGAAHATALSNACQLLFILEFMVSFNYVFAPSRLAVESTGQSKARATRISARPRASPRRPERLASSRLDSSRLLRF